MKSNKHWYSLSEVSSEMNESIPDLLYFGSIGELTLGFNWLDFAIEDENNNNRLNFLFTEPYNEEEGIYTHKELPTPDYQKILSNRIATLSQFDVGLLLKNKEVSVSSAHVEDTMLIIECPGNLTIKPTIKINLSNIVIKVNDLNKYLLYKKRESIKSVKPNKTNLFADTTHTSEMLEALHAAILEYWEGKPDQDKANKRASIYPVGQWIQSKYPFIDKTTAIYMARIIKPEKYKINK